MAAAGKRLKYMDSASYNIAKYYIHVVRVILNPGYLNTNTITSQSHFVFLLHVLPNSTSIIFDIVRVPKVTPHAVHVWPHKCNSGWLRRDQGILIHMQWYAECNAEGNAQLRVETACEYSCVWGLGCVSRLTERVAPTRAYQAKYTRIQVGKLLPSS